MKLQACIGMSSLAEEYRRKAKAAEASAKATQDEVAKEVYLEVAEHWRLLAAWAETLGSRQSCFNSCVHLWTVFPHQEGAHSIHRRPVLGFYRRQERPISLPPDSNRG